MHMTQDRPQIKRHSRKALAAAAAVAAFGIIASYAFIENKTDGSSALLSYEGNENGKISALLQDKSGMTELQMDGKNFNLPQTAKLSSPYTLSSSLYSTNTGARDFVFSVSPDRKKMTVLIDGFDAEDTVTLALNDRAVFSDIHMDWSGRIELVSDLTEDRAVTACIEISKQDMKALTVCHQIPEGLGT